MRPEVSTDIELRIDGHIYQIQGANDEHIGHRQGYHMAEDGYKTTLLNVAACTAENPSVVDEVAEHIKERIRKVGDRPANRKVRRTARMKVSEAGYPPNRYLNAA